MDHTCTFLPQDMAKGPELVTHLSLLPVGFPSPASGGQPGVVSGLCISIHLLVSQSPRPVPVALESEP
jgi:hypothetical protein